MKRELTKVDREFRAERKAEKDRIQKRRESFAEFVAVRFKPGTVLPIRPVYWQMDPEALDGWLRNQRYSRELLVRIRADEALRRKAREDGDFEEWRKEDADHQRRLRDEIMGPAEREFLMTMEPR